MLNLAMPFTAAVYPTRVLRFRSLRPGFVELYPVLDAELALGYRTLESVGEMWLALPRS